MISKFIQLWRHLAPLHKAAAVALTAGNLVASVLEVVALALFGTLLLRLTQHGAPMSSLWLGGVSDVLDRAELRTVTLACAAAYLAKNALMFALAWLEARLAFGVQTHLAGNTLQAMLRQDYEQASRGNQSSKINLLTAGIYALAFNVMLPALTLVAETMLMVGLVLFLVLTQPGFVAGMLAVLCAVAGVLVVVSRRMVLRLGAARHRSDDDKMQLLAGIFNHLREMYVYSAGDRAAAHLRSLQNRLAGVNRGYQMLQSSPRFILEVALVGALLAVVYLRGEAALDPTLVVSIGVFGVAGFRLLLGINRLVSCVQAMRFAGPSIDRIVQALAVSPAPGAARGQRLRRDVQAGTDALRLRGICYAYEPGKPVLEGVDVDLRRGALVAIQGRSGAGKSTLLEIMAGLRTPADGWIELDGQRIAHKQELVGRIAYAGQQPAVFPDTIRANVAFGLAADQIDDEAVWRALARAHLDEVVRALPDQLDHRLELTQTLSGGQVQRLALARALYMDCDYLLLDEPTAALDAETETQLLATLRELAATTGVLIVSHRPAPIDAADLVVELTAGRGVTRARSGAVVEAA